MDALRFLLFPFALLYGSAVAVRNWLYDKNIFKSTHFDVPTVVVGNLCMGGTGKSPHTLLIAERLAQDCKVAVLSRGYGRTSVGFREVLNTDTAEKSGDEPLMIKQRLGDAARVFVDVNRVRGMMELIQLYPEVDVVVLDDAFQHRALQGSVNILLSRAARPFFKDFIVPVGRLREWRKGYKRSQAIIFTKVSKNNHADVVDEMKSRYGEKNVPLLLKSSFSYGSMRLLGTENQPNEEGVGAVLLVTGIAFPQPLQKHLEEKYTVTVLKFKDHHTFTVADLEKIHQKFDKLADSKKVLVTTEKDAVKLLPLLEVNSPERLNDWRVQKIEPQLDKENELFDLINTYVRKNQRVRSIHSK